MADETVRSDDAAIAAVSDFWNQNPDLEVAAAREVPESEPSNATPAPRRNLMLAQELADQQMSLEQEGELDPTQPDGVPAEPTKQNKTTSTTKQPATGKAAAPATESETPVEGGLDPVLRSIAEDAGWTAEKIERFYKADPELATETFEQLADQYANLSRQFLENPGNSQPAFNQNVQPAQVPVQPQQQAASQLPAVLTDESLKRFAEENGEQSANLIKAIRDHFVARDAETEQRISRFEQQAKQAEIRAIAQEATATLGTLTEKFPNLYGKGDNPQTLTLSQYQKRVELANLADQIRAGAMAQGRTLSVKDAITRAHYIVSRESVKSEARKEIAGAVKQRARSATRPPTQRNNPAAPGQSRSDDAAIAAAAEKMAEIGLND